MRTLIVVLLLSFAASAQSVADAARANRQQQQQQQQGPPPKVYTNDDLGKGDVSTGGGNGNIDVSKVPKQKQDQARTLARQILEQKKKVATLQAHLDRLQQIQSDRDKLETPPAITAKTCADDPEMCEGKRQFAMDLARTPKQLADARQKLADLQDSARKQGYPETVWDPQ